MRLSAPTMPIFLISLVLAILVALVKYGGVSIPFVSANLFESLGIAYLILLAGNLLKGI
ncbi:MAG: hypothetical protein AAGF59_09030 [Pseudomonadota bacterium]